MARKGPKPFLDLADFVPPAGREMELELLLRSAGTGPLRASNLVGALVQLRDTGDDRASSALRSYYRQELAKLGPLPWVPRPSRNGKKSTTDAEAGYATIRRLGDVTAASALTAVALAGHPPIALAGAACYGLLTVIREDEEGAQIIELWPGLEELGEAA